MRITAVTGAEQRTRPTQASLQVSDARCLAISVLCLLVLLGAAVLAMAPNMVDRPMARAINALQAHWPTVSAVAYALSQPTLQGIVVVSLLWHCWFSLAETDLRNKLAAGTLAAIFAGILARLVQRTLPTSPKPIFDAVLNLQVPSVLGDVDFLRATSFPGSHTFPSERATLYAGLAIAILLVHRRIGVLALGCTLVPELSRICLGLHYPTDIVGSVALAAAVVWPAQTRWPSAFGTWLVRWEKRSAPTFYMCAFILSYELTTTFSSLRAVGASLLG